MNKCPICSKPSGFASNGKEKIFCSNECKKSNRKNGIEINCIGCKKPFYVRPCEIKFKKYCSIKCRALIYIPRPERRKGKDLTCPLCNNKFYCPRSTLKQNKTGIKYCSMACKIKAMREGKTEWSFQKEGKDRANNPYIVKQINKVRMKEHRRIMEEHLGRKLEKWEHVHHINEDPKDNRIENLMIVTSEEHGRIHKSKKSSIST